MLGVKQYEYEGRQSGIRILVAISSVQHIEIAYDRLGKGKIMNQEQVTTENTEEKAAEVTTQSETTQQPEEAIRPKGKWFGRGIYGSKDVPIRILDGLIGVLIVVIVGMIIFFAVRGGFNIVYDTDGGSEVAARKVRYGEFLTEPETLISPATPLTGGIRKKKERQCCGISSRRKSPAI